MYILKLQTLRKDAYNELNFKCNTSEQLISEASAPNFMSQALFSAVRVHIEQSTMIDITLL